MNANLIDLLSNFGFPVVFCFLLFWHNVNVIQKNTRSIEKLEEAVDRLDETLKYKQKHPFPRIVRKASDNERSH